MGIFLILVTILCAAIVVGVVVGGWVGRRLARTEVALEPFEQLERQRRRTAAKWILLMSATALFIEGPLSSSAAAGLTMLAFVYLSALGAGLCIGVTESVSRSRDEWRAEFSELREHYSLSPAPAKVPRMLAYYLAFGLDRPDSGSMYGSNVAFFARVAKGNPELIRGYEALLRKAPHRVRLRILRVLSNMEDEKSREVLEACLNDRQFRREKTAIGKFLEGLSPAAGDFSESDREWADYNVAGDVRVILRMVDVLERPDRAREKLRAWMDSVSFSPEGAGKLNGIGIVLDLTKKEILNEEDLDLLCDVKLHRVGTTIPEPPETVSQALPFPLSDEDVKYLADKAKAKDMLIILAAADSVILQTCRDEATKRSGRVKLALLEIVACALGYLSRRQAASASAQPH